MYYKEKMHSCEWKRRREMIRWKGDNSLTRVADQEAKNSLAISLSLSLFLQCFAPGEGFAKKRRVVFGISASISFELCVAMNQLFFLLLEDFKWQRACIAYQSARFVG